VEQDYDDPPGACDPIEDRACPELDDFGDEDIDDVQTVCVLGACVVLCSSPALEEACEDVGGECIAGICYDDV
jgi:hypothetical protein